MGFLSLNRSIISECTVHTHYRLLSAHWSSQSAHVGQSRTRSSSVASASNVTPCAVTRYNHE